MVSIDDTFMDMAIGEAKKAASCDEVPVGAVLIDDEGQILSAAHNLTITTHDATAHAEIRVLREGGQKQLNYRLLNTTLYVTIEPCVMCMGAMIHSRVKRLVYGAPDPKWGAAGSLYNFGTDARFNHKIKVTGGVRLNECRELMRQFFKKRR
jgi:tRNA(adenine34) deaminase